MIFSSVFFVFTFLPVFLFLYYLCPGKCRNAVLLCGSLIFYAWGEPYYIFLMVFSIVFNYLSGIELEYLRKEKREGFLKFWFWMTIIVNLGILGFFKYYGFLLENLNGILPVRLPYRKLALPIGISFYTFQTLSYVIDVYRQKVPAQRDLIDFGTYVSMFPQLVAGPIVRYSDVAVQLKERKHSLRKFGEGSAWFLSGLAKKVLLANTIGQLSHTVFAMHPSERTVLAAWLGAVSYMLQIYFDFGGYSDMAVGLGKMFGFEFMKNFDYPYVSKSVTEFWRRWHISLGSWFREYVYIPLGGNRVARWKCIRNIFVVWLLTGFWHGADWNFIVWGLYYGVILMTEKYILKPVLERLPGIVRHAYTLFLVLIGWVLFFSPSLESAVYYLKTMFGAGGAVRFDAVSLYYLGENAWLFVIGAFCATPFVFVRFREFILERGGFRVITAVLVYAVLLLLSTAYLVNATYNPFLYFRF